MMERKAYTAFGETVFGETAKREDTVHYLRNQKTQRRPNRSL